MNHKYTIEAYDLGWLVLAPHGSNGVSVTALSEMMKLAPKNAVMDPGIAHHYDVTRTDAHVVFCVCTASNSSRWRKIIADSLHNYDSEERWWLGTDVGTSSAAMFGALSSSRYASAAKSYGKGSVPQDAEDLGRCLRMIAGIPGFRNRLHIVADTYPDTKWPNIIKSWSALESSSAAEQDELLTEI